MHILEYGILGTACAAAGIFFAYASNPLDPPEREVMSTFSSSDFDTFDRAFKVRGQDCDVGIAAHKICFGSSPLEKQLVVGEPLPEHAPLVGAEFRIIVKTDLKVPDVKTARYGQTLVLVDPQTRIVKDKMRLTAIDYATARDANGDEFSTAAST